MDTEDWSNKLYLKIVDKNVVLYPVLDTSIC